RHDRHRHAGQRLARTRPGPQHRPDPRLRSRGRRRMGRDHQAALRIPAAGDFPMSAAIFDWSLLIAQVMLGISLLACLYRMLIGPRAQDRILALDALYVVALLILVVLGIRNDSQVYFELAMLIGLLGFVGTVALAKFLMRGEV